MSESGRCKHGMVARWCASCLEAAGKRKFPRWLMKNEQEDTEKESRPTARLHRSSQLDQVRRFRDRFRRTGFKAEPEPEIDTSALDELVKSAQFKELKGGYDRILYLRFTTGSSRGIAKVLKLPPRLVDKTVRAHGGLLRAHPKRQIISYYFFVRGYSQALTAILTRNSKQYVSKVVRKYLQIRKFNSKHNTILELYFKQRERQEVIASILNCSPQNVSAHIKRAEKRSTISYRQVIERSKKHPRKKLFFINE